MAVADDLALDAERMPQADIEPVGQHHKAGGNRLAVGERDLLPVVAGGNRERLGKNHRGGLADFGADRLDQRVVHDAVLPARGLIQQIAESRDPVLAVMGGRSQHRFADSGLQESSDLLVAAEFFDPKIEGIDRMRINHDR